MQGLGCIWWQFITTWQGYLELLNLPFNHPGQHPVIAQLTPANTLIPDCFDELVVCLRQGGVVVAPTDTVYGLFGIATDPGVVGRIARLKCRSAGMPIPVAVADAAMASDLVADIPNDAAYLMQRFWPGALTIVMEARAGLPHDIVSSGTIGLRAPNHPFLLRMIRCAGHPLTATSANLSGGPQPVSPGVIDASLLRNVDFVIDAGHLSSGVPSTVLDLSKDTPHFIRVGTISQEDIEEVLGKSIRK